MAPDPPPIPAPTLPYPAFPCRGESVDEDGQIVIREQQPYPVVHPTSEVTRGL